MSSLDAVLADPHGICYMSGQLEISLENTFLLLANMIQSRSNPKVEMLYELLGEHWQMKILEIFIGSLTLECTKMYMKT